MIKRISALILILSLIFTFSPNIFAATNIITLTNLENGDIVSTDTASIDGYTSEECSEIIAYVDAVQIGNIADASSFSFDVTKEQMTIGKHTLRVVAITPLGECYEKIVDFSCKAEITTGSYMNFNDYTGSNYSSLVVGENMTVTKGTGYGGDSAVAVTTARGGKLKFYYAKGDVTASSTKSILYEDNIKFSYDVYVSASDASMDGNGRFFRSYVAMKTTDGTEQLKFTPQFFWDKTKNMLALRIGDSDSGRYYIPHNKWYRLEHTYDFSKIKNSKVGIHIEVIDKEINSAVAVIDRPQFTEKGGSKYTNGIEYIYFDVGSGDDQGAKFIFDNFSFTKEESCTGINKVLYANSGGEYSALSDGTRPSQIKGIKLMLNESLLDGVSLADVISVECGGIDVDINSAAYNSAEKSISIVTPALYEGKTVKISIKDTAFLSKTNNDMVTASFKTGYEGFGVDDVKFNLNGNEYISPVQVKDSNVFGVSFSAVSPVKTQKGIAILTVRDGKKLVSVSAKDFEVSSSAKIINITSSSLPKLKNPVLECMLLDNLQSASPLTPSFIK